MLSAIISDIVPFPFKIANELKIPSIGISNFTWYTAYRQLIEKNKLESLKEYYSLMDYHFSLAASKELKWGRIGEKEFSFISRRCDQKECKKAEKENRSDRLKNNCLFWLRNEGFHGPIRDIGFMG